MEYLNRSIEIAFELKRRLDSDGSHTSPRLQKYKNRFSDSGKMCIRCVSEILPLFEKIKKLPSPWGCNTHNALQKLLEALEAIQSLIHVQNGAVNHRRPFRNRISFKGCGDSFETDDSDSSSLASTD